MSLFSFSMYILYVNKAIECVLNCGKLIHNLYTMWIMWETIETL
jgi:hypothetical protein